MFKVALSVWFHTALYYQVYVPKHIPEVVWPKCTRKCVILVMVLGDELSFVRPAIGSFISYVNLRNNTDFSCIGLRSLNN